MYARQLNIYHHQCLINSNIGAKKRYKKDFQYTILFLAVIDSVFLIPNIEHIKVSNSSSILNNNDKSKSNFLINALNIEIIMNSQSIYIEQSENERTPMIKRCITLDLVPTSPHDGTIMLGTISKPPIPTYLLS